MKPIFRKTGKTMLACLAAASLCLYDVRAEESDIKNNSSEQSEEKKNNDGKEETVYVITDASGKSNSVIVSDWLKNTSGKKTIDDASFLEDIKMSRAMRALRKTPTEPSPGTPTALISTTREPPQNSSR